jgi:receptor protein-tyrosine kinase
MGASEITGAVWRRRTLFALTFAACVAAVVAVTFALPKTYRATTTLYVGVSKDVDRALAFDTSIGEQLARTYTTLAANANLADEVARTLPYGLSRSELLARMSFAPVERTQLLEITAEGASPDQAQQIANAYADAFVQRVRSQFARGQTQTEIAVNEPAALPTAPARPNPPLYIGLGVLLSLLLALAAVLLRDRLDTRIRVTEETVEVLGKPLLARIPVMRSSSGQAQDIRTSDAFRLLKTNIDFAAKGPAQVVVVTSPSPVEGKSTVSAQLALAALGDGESVVLIEADLRRPGLANTVAGDVRRTSHVGLTSYLAGGARNPALVVTSHSRLPGLDVIWSGPLPPNPGSLLRSRSLGRLLENLRASYDRVIIDTSPLSVGADALHVTPRGDGTIYVIDAGRTKRPTAQAALAQLETARANVLGVVLNRAPLQRQDRDGYYYQPNGDTGTMAKRVRFGRDRTRERAGV